RTPSRRRPTSKRETLGRRRGPRAPLPLRKSPPRASRRQASSSPQRVGRWRVARPSDYANQSAVRPPADRLGGLLRTLAGIGGDSRRRTEESPPEGVPTRTLRMSPYPPIEPVPSD